MSIYDDIARRKGEVIHSAVIHKFKNVREFKKMVAKNFPEYKLIKKESAAPADKTRTSSSAASAGKARTPSYMVAKNFPEYRLIKKEPAAPADKTRTSSSAGYGRQYGAISSLPE